VASEVVPCVFLAAPHPQRHITPSATEEIKLDGYRAIAVKSGQVVTLHSRTGKSLNKRFPHIVEPLRELPDGTVVDGELVALDDQGRPTFNLLQNSTSEASRIHYFLFDLLCFKDRDLTRLSLIERRVLPKSLNVGDERIKVSECIEASATEMLSAVRDQGLEGIVGKQKDSVYEPGKRSGAWIKYRVNLGQEFVIGGSTPGPHGLDALIVGYYRGDDLVYVARTRNGFVPASRRKAANWTTSERSSWVFVATNCGRGPLACSSTVDVSLALRPPPSALNFQPADRTGADTQVSGNRVQSGTAFNRIGHIDSMDYASTVILRNHNYCPRILHFVSSVVFGNDQTEHRRIGQATVESGQNHLCGVGLVS
jgi:hypothetical protein